MNKLIYFFLIAILSQLIFSGCIQSGQSSISCLDDLQGVRVGVPRGTTHEAYMKQNTEANVKSYDDTMDAISALLLGRIAVAVTNMAVGDVVVRHNPSLYLSSLDLGEDPVAIAVTKEHPALRDSINHIIGELKAGGILEDMQLRWLESEGRYKPVHVELPATGEPLRVAVSATREPFCFKNNENVINGFDVELACRIAACLNRPVQFVDMRFSALIAALQSGKADVIISLLNVTPDRKKVVEFTESYFKSSRVLILKRLWYLH